MRNRRRSSLLTVALAVTGVLGLLVAAASAVWPDQQTPTALTAPARILTRPDPSPSHRPHGMPSTGPGALPTAAVSPSRTGGGHPWSRHPTSPAGPGYPARTSAKKGVSTWDFTGVGTALADSRVSWYYNWSPQPTAGASGSAEFVPMIWGAGAVTPGTLAAAAAAGRTILGFNEPDLAGQANMSVGQALDLWPALQATGRRLGSPAVAWGGDNPGGWLDQFMAGARAHGLRVDFITLHWYGSDFSAAAVGQLARYLTNVYQRYHLPIWLTEFALIKFGDPGTFPSVDQQVSFIRAATDMLGQLSFVERYAWFALPTGKTGDATGLYRADGTPTPAGLAYRAAG